jgi:alanine racemase
VIRGPIAEISLSAIAHNLHSVQTIVNKRPVIAVVKADAYGHGAAVVSRKLLEKGVSHLAVAFAGEALNLRELGIDSPILVLFDHEDIRDYFDHDLLPVVSSFDTARKLSEEARKRAGVMKIHVKIDTGMGRIGFHGDQVIENIMRISALPGLEITGLMSHFSEADLADRSYAAVQLERFNIIRNELTKRMGRSVMAHIANSAAVMAFEQAYLNAVRPGLMLYGYSPFSDNSPPGLIPAMTVKAKILAIRNLQAGTPVSYGRTFVTKRPSKIGVLAIGYADGYNRLFSNNAHVLVRGKKIPVIGRVCMDLTMIDLTDVGEVDTDDKAVIIGRQGDLAITADELAVRAQTISYEILISLGSRSRRVYVEDH